MLGQNHRLHVYGKGGCDHGSGTKCRIFRGRRKWHSGASGRRESVCAGTGKSIAGPGASRPARPSSTAKSKREIFVVRRTIDELSGSIPTGFSFVTGRERSIGPKVTTSRSSALLFWQ